MTLILFLTYLLQLSVVYLSLLSNVSYADLCYLKCIFTASGLPLMANMEIASPNSFKMPCKIWGHVMTKYAFFIGATVFMDILLTVMPVSIQPLCLSLSKLSLSPVQALTCILACSIGAYTALLFAAWCLQLARCQTLDTCLHH